MLWRYTGMYVRLWCAAYNWPMHGLWMALKKKKKNFLKSFLKNLSLSIMATVMWSGDNDNYDNTTQWLHLQKKSLPVTWGGGNNMSNYNKKKHTLLLAFYSSVTNSITDDPLMMNVPIDDHMVHRGHAVFDTANICGNGKYVYGLTQHIDRFFNSAKQARIKSPVTKEELRKLICQTAGVAIKVINNTSKYFKTPYATEKNDYDGLFVRYWMSIGRGSMGISPPQNQPGTLYILIERYATVKKTYQLAGIPEVTVTIPPKPKLLGTMKTNNYLLNALCVMEAKDKNGSYGIQIREENNKKYVLEGSINTIIIVDKNENIRTTSLEYVLKSTTTSRIYTLLNEQKHNLPILKNKKLIYDGYITIDDLENAQEILSAGGHEVVPIVKINGKCVGDGKKGKYFKAMHQLLSQDPLNPSLFDSIIPYDNHNTENSHKNSKIKNKMCWKSFFAGSIFVSSLTLLLLASCGGGSSGGSNKIIVRNEDSSSIKYIV